jgi:branched-chain amino acid transport system substrate-binding protein
VAAQQWLATAAVPYRLELVWDDDAFDAAQTRCTAERLVRGGSIAVIGHLASSAALPAAAVYHRAHLPYFAPGASHPHLTAMGFWNTLRVYGRDDDLANMFARVVVAAGQRKAALVWQPMPYGQSLAWLIQRALLERGLDLVAKFPWQGQGSSRQAAALADADVVLFAGTYQAGAQLLRHLRAIGCVRDIVLGDDAYIAELPALVGEWPAAASVISTGVAPTQPAYASFYKLYVARAGLAPGAYAVTSYIAMHLLLQTLEVLLADGPVACLTRVRALAATEASLLGPLYFTPTGDLLAFPWAVYRIQNGHFIPQSLPTEGHHAH